MSAGLWKPVVLGDHSLKIGSGATPRGGETVYLDDGIALIRSQNIYNGKFEYAGLAHIGEEHADELAGVTVEDGDILLNITVDSVARCCLVPEAVLPARVNQHVAIIRPNPDDFDSRFLAYYLISPYMQRVMLSLAGSGGTRKALTKEMIEDFIVPRPDISVQQRIVEVLSTYDELIANARRRTSLLLDAVEHVFREWFVRLRFPGSERTVFVDGVPKGWSPVEVDDVCNVGRGASPRPIAEFMGGEIPWFKIGDATASDSPFILRTEEFVTDEGAQWSVSLPPKSLILSNSATCGLPYFTGIHGCIHDGWLHFSDYKRISAEFLYCFLSHKQRELVSSVGDGSTQKNLNTSAVGRLCVLLPKSDSLLTQFDDAAGPIFSMILNLSLQSQRLEEARDLILPKMMGREVKPGGNSDVH